MILLALLGCPGSRLLCVTPTAQRVEAVQLELGRPGACAETPTIDRVDVRRGPDEETVWSLRASEGVPVRQLTYGTVPTGFEQPVPAAELAPGDTLVFEIRGEVERGGLELTVAP
jgi:hypothetical protein